MKPRVVVCEYNPTLPPYLEIYAPYDSSGKEFGFGCSVGALIKVGKQKGYTLVAITDVNAFFVRNDELKHFDSFEIALDKIKMDRYVRYVVTDYTGSYAVIASENFVEPYGCVHPLTLPILGNVKKLAP